MDEYRIWVISDTHQKFKELKVPENVDFCICAGDATDSKAISINQNELLEFYDWVSELPFDMIMTPGNHDMVMQSSLIGDFKPPKNLKVLKHQMVTYKGIKFFGSPYTPSFGQGWAFNVKREKIDRWWKEIPEDTDILITHGPPKGILDVTRYKRGELTQVGDRSLLRHVKRVKPKYHIFGHLHDEKDVHNAGMFFSQSIGDTTFINAACINLDRKLVNNGTIIKYKK